MRQLKANIIINRPPAEVFAGLTDFGQWPRWQGGLAGLIGDLIIRLTLKQELKTFKTLVEEGMREDKHRRLSDGLG